MASATTIRRPPRPATPRAGAAHAVRRRRSRMPADPGPAAQATNRSVRSRSAHPRRISPIFAAASRRRAGPTGDWSPTAPQGVQLATMQELARYWATEYDWRRCEARLNALPNFITDIDGLDIHFIHVRSKHENALPVIVTHGWPGSVVEQLKIIDPLTDPTAHGGSAADAFDVVIPSMPGYGFSGKPTRRLGPAAHRAAWIALMKRLGYTHFVAQGGDWGALITENMGALAPPELIGIHINMPSTVPPEIFEALRAGEARPAGLTAEESRAYRAARLLLHERPRLRAGDGAAPADALRDRGFAGRPRRLVPRSRQRELPDDRPRLRRPERGSHARRRSRQYHAHLADQYGDLRGAALLGSAAAYLLRFRHRVNNVHFFAPIGVSVPVAVSAFPDELYQAPRSWAERAYPKLIHLQPARRKAGISPPGNSRAIWWTSSGPGSDRSAEPEARAWGEGHERRRRAAFQSDAAGAGAAA